MGEQFPYVALFMALILGSVGFPFPEDAVLLWCGFLISTSAVEPLQALLVVYLGVITSDFLLFSIGRRYGRLIVGHKRLHRILSHERLSALELKFNTRGVLLVFIGRQIFWLRAKVFLAAGILKMSPRKFLVTDAVSAIVSVAAMVTAGDIGSEWLLSLGNLLTQRWYVIAAVTVMLVTVFILLRNLNAKRQNSNSALSSEV